MLLALILYGVSTDCPNLVSFAATLRMNTKQAAIYTQLQSNCCTATGVTCDVTPRVTQISWTNLGLDGTINAAWLPSTLTFLDLNRNALTGSIPSNFPAALTYFNLEFNILTGPVPASLPAGLTFLRADNNQLSGSIPTLPVGLTFIDLSYNLISGSFPILPSTLQTVYFSSLALTGTLPTLPPGLSVFWIQGNSVTGPLPKLPSSLGQLYLDGNQLSGDVPAMPSGIGAVNLGPGNRFTGSLVLSNPSFVSIVNTWITDIIITNSGSLVSCDLSNTPLLGNPHLSNLGSCTKTGLYSASALPNTLKTSSLVKTNVNSLTTGKRATTSTSVVTTTTISTTVFSARVITDKNTLEYALNSSTQVSYLEVFTTLLDYTNLVSGGASTTHTLYIPAGSIVQKTISVSVSDKTYAAVLQGFNGAPKSTMVTISIFSVLSFLINTGVLCWVVYLTPFTQKRRKQIKSRLSSYDAYQTALRSFSSNE